MPIPNKVFPERSGRERESLPGIICSTLAPLPLSRKISSAEKRSHPRASSTPFKVVQELPYIVSEVRREEVINALAARHYTNIRGAEHAPYKQTFERPRKYQRVHATHRPDLYVRITQFVFTDIPSSV